MLTVSGANFSAKLVALRGMIAEPLTCVVAGNITFLNTVHFKIQLIKWQTCVMVVNVEASASPNDIRVLSPKLPLHGRHG